MEAVRPKEGGAAPVPGVGTKTYSSRSSAVSERVSWTALRLTMLCSPAQSMRTAISCLISLSLLCARRRRFRNFAAKWEPVFL